MCHANWQAQNKAQVASSLGVEHSGADSKTPGFDPTRFIGPGESERISLIQDGDRGGLKDTMNAESLSASGNRKHSRSVLGVSNVGSGVH